MLVASTASAADPSEPVSPTPAFPSAAPTPPPARIRSGFMLGLSVAGALGASSGYPADIKLQTPDYYGSTPLLPGTAGRLLVMGALADYLNIGFFVARGSFGNSTWDMTTGGGGLRAEAFPLISVCSCKVPAWFTRGFGVYGEAGVGSVTTHVKAAGNYEDITGIQSHLAIGLLQEFFAGRNFTFAPDLRYEVVTSSSADKNALALGIRIAWYPGN